MKIFGIIALALFGFSSARAELIDVTTKVSQMSCALNDEGEDSKFMLSWYPGSPSPSLYASWQCGLLKDCSNTFRVESITFETDRLVYTAKLAQDAGFAVIYMKNRGGVYNRPRGEFLLSGKIRRNGYNCIIN